MIGAEALTRQSRHLCFRYVLSHFYNLSVFPHMVRAEQCCGLWCKKISHLEKFFHSMASVF